MGRAGAYNQKVTDFASLTTAQDAADVFDRLAKFEACPWPSSRPTPSAR